MLVGESTSKTTRGKGIMGRKGEIRTVNINPGDTVLTLIVEVTASALMRWICAALVTEYACVKVLVFNDFSPYTRWMRLGKTDH
jgi:hypothetical protein